MTREGPLPYLGACADGVDDVDGLSSLGGGLFLAPENLIRGV